MDKNRIVKVKKNGDGDITDVMFDNGAVHSVQDAISMAKEGIIHGVNVGRAKNGREFIRSNPNGCEGDNLDSLPEIE